MRADSSSRAGDATTPVPRPVFRSAKAGKERMNKCLPVPVPQEPCKPSGLSASKRSEAGLAFRRTARNVSRLSLGFFLLGLSGNREATPLIGLLRAVVPLFRAFPKRSATDQLFRRGNKGHSRGEAGASDLSGALPLAEPGRNRPDRTFRGIWTRSGPGNRLGRKRLMRMNHRLPNPDRVQ
jgi:hypothetical protein